MGVIEYIPAGRENAITRKELQTLTGLSDRESRRQVEDLKESTPIINLQNGEGYFVPTFDDVLDAKRYVHQEKARIRALQRSIQPVIDWLIETVGEC